MNKTILIIAALAFAGCGTFTTKQRDIRELEKKPDGTHKEITTVTTTASARTWFSSKLAVRDWRAGQSEGQQTASTASLESQGATNTVQTIEAGVEFMKQMNRLFGR